MRAVRLQGAFVGLAFTVFAACGHSHGPGEIHRGTSAISDDGHLEVSYTAEPSPPARGENLLRLTIHDRDGRPFTGGRVVVEPFMPHHGHGSSQTPVTTETGEGGYRVENVVLDMPGEWYLVVHMEKGSLHDHVTFAVRVE